ncbi:MAG: hypothetical protein WDW36_003026 [Sanguina aurantia]
MVDHPLLTDDLACHLAGAKALGLAEQELASLSAQQGPGKHLRVPARSRLLDDALKPPLQTLANTGSSCNVVALGAGMDTRPWRLRQTSSLSAVHWYDVDFPAIVELKRKLLARARAETGRNERTSEDATASSPAASSSSADASASALTPLLTTPVSPVTTPPGASTQDPDSSAACAQQSDSPPQQQGASIPQSSFPLLTASWTAVPHDLADGSLAAALEVAGFNSHLPTIWLAEAVLYYMPVAQAAGVLQMAASLSHPGSALLATCVDAELLQASRDLQAGHVFANLFQFEIDELLRDGLGQHWTVQRPPETTKVLAARLLGADCYVAEYGGAECMFTAVLTP